MDGGCRWIDDRGRSRGELCAPPRWMTASMAACLDWSPIPHMSTYVSRELFDELGGFNKSFRYSGDYDFFLRALEWEPFTRLPMVVSSFRRHGANQSMQHDALHVAENARVADRFGPTGGWQRRAYRLLLKVWLNGRNPRWSLYKRIDALKQSRPTH